MITQSSNIQAELVTWKFSGTISSVNDPNGALSSSGVNLNSGDPFTIMWTYDPTIGPTIQNTEVAQWQFGTNRSSMIMDIDGYVWDSDINFNDQVFDNGLNENVTSGFRTDLGSTVTTPLDASFTPSITATSWALHATQGQDVLPDFSWPVSIDLAQWDQKGLEIFEEGIDVHAQSYTYTIYGDITSWTVEPCTPTCSISLTGTAGAHGVDICLANSCLESNLIEWKTWLEFQGQKISIVNAGSDGSIVLPAGFSSCFTLIPPSIDLPSGLVWGIRLIGPVKGEEFCVHTVTVP